MSGEWAGLPELFLLLSFALVAAYICSFSLRNQMNIKKKAEKFRGSGGDRRALTLEPTATAAEDRCRDALVGALTTDGRSIGGL